MFRLIGFFLDFTLSHLLSSISLFPYFALFFWRFLFLSVLQNICSLFYFFFRLFIVYFSILLKLHSIQSFSMNCYKLQRLLSFFFLFDSFFFKFFFPFSFSSSIYFKNVFKSVIFFLSWLILNFSKAVFLKINNRFFFLSFFLSLPLSLSLSLSLSAFVSCESSQDFFLFLQFYSFTGSFSVSLCLCLSLFLFHARVLKISFFFCFTPLQGLSLSSTLSLSLSLSQSIYQSITFLYKFLQRFFPFLTVNGHFAPLDLVLETSAPTQEVDGFLKQEDKKKN